MHNTWAEALPLAALGLLAATLIMLAMWRVHVATANASWVDVGWAATLGVLAALYGVLGTGYAPRRLLVAVVVGVWSVRLATHLATRVMAEPEDPRYGEMRARWGGNLAAKFFTLFVGQGVLDVVLALSFLFAAVDQTPRIAMLSWIGAAIAALGMLGEATADYQLRQFKGNASNKGKVCRIGLWGWSRHPNYFFDWTVWCGFALLGLASPWGWLGLIAPMLMLYFLTRVTGIAATEAHAVQSRGELYRQYQREVSAFVPLPRALAQWLGALSVFTVLSVLSLLSVLSVAACGEPMRGVEISDAEAAPPLVFTAFNGTRFDLASQQKKVVLVYFGYTHCPDVCPTTLSDWARARRALGEDAAQVAWVFVSMDPDRDTPELAFTYAQQFDPAFLGVTGTTAELEALKQAWGIAAYPEGDTREQNYTVAHPAYTFVVDRDGRLRFLYEPGVSGEDLAKDLRRLL